MAEPKPTFAGEVQFRRYSDTSTQGVQVVLALADREALAAFIGKEGKRFMAVLVEIGDDEQPVEPQPTERFKPGPICREAIDLCAMPQFWMWLEFREAVCKNEADAKAAVLRMCQIESRKELDTLPYATDLFRTEIRIPFMRWQREQRKKQLAPPTHRAEPGRAVA